MIIKHILIIEEVVYMTKLIMIFGKEFIQKIAASVIGKFIYDTIKGILKVAIVILIIVIVAIYMIQYSGIYDIFALLSDWIPSIAPYLDKIDNHMGLVTLN